MRWFGSVTDAVGTNLSKLQEMVRDGEAWRLQSMGFQRVRHNLATEQLIVGNCPLLLLHKLAVICFQLLRKVF